MEKLIEQAQETKKLLGCSKTEWNACSSSIANLAEAVESLENVEDYSDVVQLFLGLSSEIGSQLLSIRSKLVKDVCEYLLRIVLVTGRGFKDMANALLPQIIDTSKSASAAIRQPGAKLLSKLSELVRYDLTLLKQIYMQSKQGRPRVMILEQLRIIFVYWSDDEVLPREQDVLEIVHQGLLDRYENVRETARDVLSRFSSRWSDRVDELVDLLPMQTMKLLARNYHGTALATAITGKHPGLAANAEILLHKRAVLRTGAIYCSQNKRDRRTQVQASGSTTLNRCKKQKLSRQISACSELVVSQTAVVLEMTNSVQRSSDTLGPYGESVDTRTSKPISSLSAAPTFPPLSQDNVTHRPGRRMLVHQQGDTLAPQIDASLTLSLETPTVDKSAKHWSVEATSPSVVCGSRPYLKAARSLVSEQCVDDVLDDADDSNRAESDGYLDHPRLECIRLLSGSDGNFLERDDEAKPITKTEQYDWCRDERSGHMLDAVSEHRRLDYCQSRYGSDNGAIDKYDDKLNQSEPDAVFDEARVRNYTEEEECERENSSVDTKLESMGIDDALIRLLEVQIDMTRIRTHTEHGKRFDSGVPVDNSSRLLQHMIDAAQRDAVTREQVLVRRSLQPWEERRLSVSGEVQSLLLVPTVDTEAARLRTSRHPEQVAEHIICQTADVLYVHEWSQDSNGFELQVKHSTRRAHAPTSARSYESGSVGFSHNFVTTEPTYTPLPNVPRVAQTQETVGIYEQQTGRFHAVEKLFASKTRSIKSRSNKPLSLQHERSTELIQEMLLPTDLRARLHSSFTEDQEIVQGEAVGEVNVATKALPAEDVAALVDEERVAAIEEDTPDPLSIAPEMKASPAKFGWVGSFATTIAVLVAAIYCKLAVVEQ